MLAVIHSTFLEDEPSGQGKAGALWETAFPLLRPLPSPRTTPSWALAPTLRDTASASPASCPQRAVRLPSGWTLERSTACRDGRVRERASKSSRRLRRFRTLGRKETFAKSSPARQAASVQCSLSRQEAHFSTLNNSPCNPAQCDALGRRAAEGVPDSQSASEQGGSAKRERALRTKLASSGGQLTKRTEQGARRAQARATCSGSEALVLTAKNRKVFQESRAGSCRAKLNIPRQHSALSRSSPPFFFPKICP